MLEEEPIQSEGGTSTTRSHAPARKRRRVGVDRTTVGVAALIALGGAGLYYMHYRTAAAVAMVGEEDSKAATLDALLAGGREGLSSLTRDVEATRETIERFSKRDSATLAAARFDERDPFAFRTLELKVTTTAPVVAKANNASRDLAKAKALAAAQRLQLQSIMYGSARRSCLIDGKLYFEGQPLGEFTLSRISPDAVLLQTGELRFELRLRK